MDSFSDILTESDSQLEFLQDCRTTSTSSTSDDNRKPAKNTPEVEPEAVKGIASLQIDEGQGQQETQDGADDETTLLEIARPLPKEQSPKPLVFGAKVEAVRNEIMTMRQECKTTEEYNTLYGKIDAWIDYARSKQEDAIAIRLLLDKSIVAHFGLDFDNAIKLSEDALERALFLSSPDERFQLSLVGRFVQASIHSRRGEYGRAFGALRHIQTDIQSSTNSLDHWRLHYNMGTYYLGQLKVSSIKDDRLCYPGVDHFKKCRDAIADGESRGQTYSIENHFFALVMSAKLLLALPEHKLKREIVDLSRDRITEAQKLLQLICTDYPVPDMNIRFKLRLLITFAGLYFRRGQRYKKELNDSEARGSFTDAMLFLECGSLISKDSPYEEHNIIQEFLKHTQEKTESSFLHRDLDIRSGMYTFKPDTSSSDHDLNKEDDGFTSEDFGNPTTSNKSRKRRTRKVLNLNRIRTDSLSSSTSKSSASTFNEPYAAYHFYGCEEDVLSMLITIARDSDSSTSDSLSSSLSSSSGSSTFFRLHRDTLPSDEYPTYEQPPSVNYDSTPETESTDEAHILFQTESEEGIPFSEDKTRLKPKRYVQLRYQALAKDSIHDSVYGTKTMSDNIANAELRRKILFEINHVHEYVCSQRKLSKSKENTCVALLVSAKFALDFPETSIGRQRFVVSLTDLISVSKTIKLIKESLPIYTGVSLKIEFLLLLSSYYFRCAQMASKYKQVATSKFCVNMALMYADFALIFAQETFRSEEERDPSMDDKERKCADMKSFLEDLVGAVHRRKDYTVLLP